MATRGSASVTTVNTVLGPIDTNDLGFTLMHEHILFGSWAMRQAFPDWIDLDALLEEAVREVLAAKQLGVQTIVDVTPINGGRDIYLLREVSARTGVKIIAARTSMLLSCPPSARDVPWNSMKNLIANVRNGKTAE